MALRIARPLHPSGGNRARVVRIIFSSECRARTDLRKSCITKSHVGFRSLSQNFLIGRTTSSHTTPGHHGDSDVAHAAPCGGRHNGNEHNGILVAAKSALNFTKSARGSTFAEIVCAVRAVLRQPKIHENITFDPLSSRLAALPNLPFRFLYLWGRLREQPSTSLPSLPRRGRRIALHAVLSATVLATFLELRNRAQSEANLKAVLADRAQWLRTLELNEQVASESHFSTSLSSPTDTSPSRLLNTNGRGSTTLQTRPPVLYVPGYKASKLVDRQSGRTAWGDFSTLANIPTCQKNSQLGTVPTWDESANVQQPDAFVPADLVTKFKLLHFFTLHPGQSGLRELLCRSAVQEGRSYYEFCYDWRRSAVEVSCMLEQAVYKIKERENGVAPQVIAHSFGALVTLYCVVAKDRHYPGDPAAIPTDSYRLQQVDGAPPRSGHKSEDTQVVFASVGAAKNEEPRIEQVPLEPPPRGEGDREIRQTCKIASEDDPLFRQKKIGGILRPASDSRANKKSTNEDDEQRFHSILLAAPPVRMTPYFVMDMATTDPHYMLRGKDHFSFSSVFTFFPDNVYNPDGRSVQVFQERSRNGKETVKRELIGFNGQHSFLDSSPEERNSGIEEGVETTYAGNVRWWGKGEEGTCFALPRAILEKVSVTVNSCLEPVRRILFANVGPYLRKIALHQMLPGEAGDHLRRYLHSKRQASTGSCLSSCSDPSSWNVWANDEAVADHACDDYFFGELQRVGEICLDWMQTATWEQLFPDVFAEAEAKYEKGNGASLRKHVDHALEHSALFWRRIASATYGEEGISLLERWILQTRPETTADFQRLMATRSHWLTTKKNEGSDEDDTMPTVLAEKESSLPPIAFLWTDGFPTGEQIVGVLGHDTQHRDRIYFDGSDPRTVVPGDGRLPAGRLTPRDMLGDALVLKTETRHAMMMNEVEVVDGALRGLVEMRLQREEARSK